MPPEPTSARLRRLTVLVPWVIAHGEPTVEDVCARFGITEEELTADVELLMVCGLPPFTPGDYIEAFLEDGKVSIWTGQALERPPRLTRDEALALLVSGRAIAAVAGDDEGPLRSALDKLAKALAPTDAEFVTGLADRIRVELDAPGSELLPVLGDAIEGRRRLRMTYFSAGRGEMTERVVEPMLVLQDRGAWYLIAHDAGAERTFRVDRIRDLAPTGDTFEPPAGFDPAAYEGGLSLEPGPGDTRVVLSFEPEAAWLAEVLPAERTGEDRLELRTSRLGWLVPLLLAAGTHARVLEPAELAEQVRATAARALARYSSTGA